MAERRKAYSRHAKACARFPLYSNCGEKIGYERRLTPTGQLRDITVREISCPESISGMNS